VLTYILEERIASIFRVEDKKKFASDPAEQVQQTQVFLPSTLKMEAIRSSETSLNTISTRRHIPEDGFFHSHCPENLKSYKELISCSFSFTHRSLLTEGPVIVLMQNRK
jgi:hypothetical protein